MTIRRALIISGTGMLAECAADLVRAGWRVVLPSRRYLPIHLTRDGEPPVPDSSDTTQAAAASVAVGTGSAGRGSVGGLVGPGAGGTAHWVGATWSEPAELAARSARALGGKADLLVAWLPTPVRAAVMQAVAPVLASDAAVVEVHNSGSADPIGGCPEPVLAGHPTQQLVLGYRAEGERTRWLTHQEVVAGVLDAVRRAIDTKPPAVHQVGQFRAWSGRRAPVRARRAGSPSAQSTLLRSVPLQ